MPRCCGLVPAFAYGVEVEASHQAEADTVGDLSSWGPVSRNNLEDRLWLTSVVHA